MNRPGQPQQRPPNLAPNPTLGGPFRPQYPNYGLPPRNVNVMQSAFVTGPGLPPTNHRAPGQQTQNQNIVPQASSAFMQQRGQGVFSFGGALGQAQQQQQPQPQHQQPQQHSTPLHQQSQQHQQQQHSNSLPPPNQQQNGSSNTLQSHLNPTTPSLGAPSVSSASELGLDPNDFPALGSTTANNNASSSNGAGAGVSGSTSYATQAGTGVGLGGATLGSLNPNPGRDFTQDDFPALGGTQSQGQQGNLTSTNVQTQENHSHPPGLNGFQHSDHSQQQNRTSLLSSLGGTIQTPGMLNLAPAQARQIHPGFQQNQAESEKQQQQQRNNYNMKLTQSAVQAVWNSTSSNPPQTGSQQNGAHPPQNQASMGLSTINAATGARLPFAQQPPQLPPPQPQQQQQQSNQPLSGTVFPPTNGIPQQPEIHNPNVPVAANPNEPAQQLSASSLPQTPAQQILMSAADRWGLLGLLTMIQNASLEVDQGLSSVGTDLGTMGLDMGFSGKRSNLYSTFITPFADQSAARTVEPDFHLPACYAVATPPPGPAKAQTFNDETLLFMFYSSPRDALQEIAAQELYNRNWRFHKELRLWITKESTAPAATKIHGGEQGLYVVWDPENWTRERKELQVVYTDLEDKSIPAFVHGPGLVLASAQQDLQQHQQTQRGSFQM